MIKFEWIHNSIQKFLSDLYPTIPVYHSNNSNLADGKDSFITWHIKENNIEDFNKPSLTVLINLNLVNNYDSAVKSAALVTTLIESVNPLLNVDILDSGGLKVGSLVCMGSNIIQAIKDNNFLMQPVMIYFGYVQTI